MKSILNNVAVFLMLCFLGLGCGTTKPNKEMAPLNEVYSITDSLTVWEEALNFLVVGDWGRKGYYHQQDVADRMEQTAEILDAKFIVALGDNFYPDGVASIDDPNWMLSYENIYKGYHLNIPWYVVLGNHDYRGNPQAQVDYTHKSRRWEMPERFYALDFEDEDFGAKVSFLFIDSSPLIQDYYGETKYGQVIGQDTIAQINWIENKLREKSTSDWLLVAGHHPLYSGGKRLGETDQIKNSLEPIFKRYKVDAYFAGHEHDLQHIKKPEENLHYFISGAGSEVRKTGTMDITKFAASVQGFMAVSILKKRMLVQIINYKGNLIYTTEITKPDKNIN